MKKYIVELINKTIPRYLVLLIDLVTVSINFILTYFVLNEFSTDFNLVTPFQQLPYVMLVSLFCFLIVGSYKGVIRHTGLRDTISLYVSVSFIALILLLLSYLNNTYSLTDVLSLNLSIIFLGFLLNAFTLISSRYLFKFIYKSVITKEMDFVGANVLVFGAGEMGNIVYSTLQKSNERKSLVKGFVDDDIKKQGNKIDRIKIFSLVEIDRDFILSQKIEEVIIAIKDISRTKLGEISDKFLNLGVKVKMVPPVFKWVDGDLNVNQIKQIKIEDLLNRRPIELSNPAIDKEVFNKVVLVTGAAGSIGSEIVRQLSQYNCEKIVLVDQSESALYDVQQNLKRKNKEHIHCTGLI